MVILFQSQLSLRREKEKPFDCFDFLNREVAELAARLEGKRNYTSRPRRAAAAPQGRIRTKASDASEDAAVRSASCFLSLAQNEGHTPYGLQELRLELPVDLSAQANHLRIDDVVKRRLPGRPVRRRKRCPSFSFRKTTCSG